ncbi:MFS transporter, partial [Lysinibacillus sphaericus]
MKKQPIFTTSFLFLFISNFFIFIGFEMLLPILPAYLLSINATPMQVGLVTTVFTLGAIIIRPFIGYYLIDHKRKHLAIGAGIMLLMITMLYPFLSTIWIFLLLRFFHGTAWGIS